MLFRLRVLVLMSCIASFCAGQSPYGQDLVDNPTMNPLLPGGGPAGLNANGDIGTPGWSNLKYVSADWVGSDISPISGTYNNLSGLCPGQHDFYLGILESEAVGAELFPSIQEDDIVRVSWDYKLLALDAGDWSKWQISLSDEPIPNAYDGVGNNRGWIGSRPNTKYKLRNNCRLKHRNDSFTFGTGELDASELNKDSCEWNHFDSGWLVADSRLQRVVVASAGIDNERNCRKFTSKVLVSGYVEVTYLGIDNVRVQRVGCNHPCVNSEFRFEQFKGGFPLPATNQQFWNFSPDNDGINDYIGFTVTGASKVSWKIISRDGVNQGDEIVNETFNIPNGTDNFTVYWDGTNGGQMVAPFTTYFVEIEIRDCNGDIVYSRKGNQSPNALNVQVFNPTGPPRQPSDYGYNSLNSPDFNENCLCAEEDLLIANATHINSKEYKTNGNITVINSNFRDNPDVAGNSYYLLQAAETIDIKENVDFGPNITADLVIKPCSSLTVGTDKTDKWDMFGTDELDQEPLEDSALRSRVPNQSTGAYTFTPLFELYPNPTTGTLKLQTNLPESQQASIHIVDATGKSVLRQQVDIGPTEAQINMGDLSAGLYLVRVTGQGIDFTQKIQLIKR